ncbi:MAG TPA: type I-U CRISPR-associated helicase/endonuclease Cas3 [Acidimicrobiales bacterium]|nr:type I-U CRISPR-associated helicase/endonuclease Cas3 [Acidimicrobiales bacterium]
MADLPTFDDFYAAVNGRAAFPWQSRLAARLADGGSWPEEVGVPTGLGKTACLDIAVWWLASQAPLPPAERTAPTRIWWLVNRRLLVDTTYDHATRISDLLRDPSAVPEGEAPRETQAIKALGGVAAALRSLSADPAAPPLEVVRLRGGAATGRPTDPSQPAVILSTLPMYGSRLLFRGYGSSRSMRPIDAALAGTDSLVLVDEAHLAQHLMRLFGPLAECEAPAEAVLPALRARPTVVSLTATGGAVSDRFDLDETDRANPEVHRRLTAKKNVRCEVHGPASDKELAGHLGDAGARLLLDCDAPSSMVVFANTPKVARQVRARLGAALRKESIDAEILLLTGQMREREAVAIRKRVLDPGSGAAAGRADAPRERHLVVIATQTLEVGADVDFELLVTEACGVRALTQRLGRLNRLGKWDRAQATYVHAPPRPIRGEETGWPVYGTEPETVLRQLEEASDPSGVVDLQPGRVAAILGEPGDEPGDAPEIMPALLWQWSKTSFPPPGEAPVEPYFSGLTGPHYRVSVCWRAYVPGDGDRLWPRVRDAETIDLPIGEARTALGDGAVARLTSDRVRVEHVAPDALRPGDTVILPIDGGMLDDFGWAPDATSPVCDVTLSSEGLPLDAAALKRLVGEDLGGLVRAVVEPPDEDEVSPDERVAELVERLRAAQADGMSETEWAELLDRLEPDAVLPVDEIPRIPIRESALEPLADELDELSLSDTAVLLHEHGRGVGGRAGAVAAAIGVPAQLADVVAQSARFHDVGKADERFQRWLAPGATDTAPVAKSHRPRAWWGRDRVAAGWPQGGRHEALSGRLVEEWLEQATDGWAGVDRDLLIHLVVTHHGWGRPLLPPADDQAGGKVTFELDGTEVSADADLSATDWQQPRRFRALTDRYGTWGVALLEAIVRQADQSVSAGGWAPDQEVL